MKPYEADPYFQYLLTKQPMAAKHIGIEIGIARSTLQGHLNRLRTERKIYIAQWEKIGSTIIAYYAWGKQRSARKPGATQIRVLRAAFYKRLKADPDRYERKIKRDRIRHAIERVKVRPATWFSVLGVM